MELAPGQAGSVYRRRRLELRLFGGSIQLPYSAMVHGWPRDPTVAVVPGARSSSYCWRYHALYHAIATGGPSILETECAVVERSRHEHFLFCALGAALLPLDLSFGARTSCVWVLEIAKAMEPPCLERSSFAACYLASTRGSKSY